MDGYSHSAFLQAGTSCNYIATSQMSELRTRTKIPIAPISAATHAPTVFMDQDVGVPSSFSAHILPPGPMRISIVHSEQGKSFKRARYAPAN